MESKKFGNSVVVRVDKGEEIIESLKKACEEHKVKLGFVTGIGATNNAKIGLFDPETKEYHSTELKENFEIAPLCGNISTMDGKTYLHIHANLCNREHKSFGGHLNSAIVSATFEAVIQVVEGEIGRAFDQEIGLNLIKF
jgi:hypothetical protein